MCLPPSPPAYAEMLLAAYDDNFPMAEQVSKKLFLLEILSETFFADDVQYLLPCLFDAQPEVRKAVMQMITEIVRRLYSRTAFQRALRPVQWPPEMLDALDKQFQHDDRLAILALASFSRSGYTRQRAVVLLREYCAFDSLPYLLWRVGDCVPEVSGEAVAAISSLLNVQNAGYFLNYFELVQGLYNSAKGDSVRLYLSIASLLLGTSPDVLFEMIQNDTRHRRLLLQFFGQFRVHREWVKKRILGDSDYSVRCLVFHLPSWYEEIKLSDLVYQLSGDPHPGIRYAALVEYGKRFIMDRTIVNWHLTDPSRAVRRLARQLLGEKDQLNVDMSTFSISPRDFGLKRYNKLACQLLSMSEIPSLRSEATALIGKNMLHEDPAVQYAALRGMDLLSMPDAERFALHYLGSPRRCLRHRAAKILARSGNQDYIVSARRDFPNAPTSLKLGALKLFSLVGGQQAREDLIGALRDDTDAVRRAALRHLMSCFNFKLREYTFPDRQSQSIDQAWRKHLGAMGDWAARFVDNRSVSIDALMPSPHEKLRWRGTQAQFITYVLLFTDISGFRDENGAVWPDEVGDILVKVYDIDLSPYADFQSMRMAVAPSADPELVRNKVMKNIENRKNIHSALEGAGVAPSRETQLETMAILALELDLRRRLSPYIRFPTDRDGDFL